MKEEEIVCNCGIVHTKFCVDCNTDIMKKARLEEQKRIIKILKHKLYYPASAFLEFYLEEEIKEGEQDGH